MGIVLSAQAFVTEMIHPALKYGPGTKSTALTLGRDFMICCGVAWGVMLVVRVTTRTEQDTVYHESLYWPAYMTKRLVTTYSYYLASLCVTAMTMKVIALSDTLGDFAFKHAIESSLMAVIALFFTDVMLFNISNEEKPILKRVVYFIQNVVYGFILAPIMRVAGSSVLAIAASYTGLFLVGGAASVFFTERNWSSVYVNLMWLLEMAMVISSLANVMYWPPGTTTGSVFYAINLYGGTVFFSWWWLRNMNLVFQDVSLTIEDSASYFDPTFNSMLMTTISFNIYLRVVVLCCPRPNSI